MCERKYLYSPWRSEYLIDDDCIDSTKSQNLDSTQRADCVNKQDSINPKKDTSRFALSMTDLQTINLTDKADTTQSTKDSKDALDCALSMTDKQDSTESKSCTFCKISHDILNNENLKKHYVFYNDNICFGVMNLYPYTPGHFMLIPHAHIDTPTLLAQNDWLHISNLSQKAIKLLESYGAEGVNMGINIKQAAGAGIPKHLHLHFVPRFRSDTNFITSIANTRIYGLDFDKVFDRILELSKEIFKEFA